MTIHDLATPSVLIDLDRLENNLKEMQTICNQHHVELWPHIKTHKSVEILKRQIAYGAKGATCAKLSEAEALLPSGIKQFFIAHSLVDPAIAPRLRALSEKLDRLLLAVTSELQAEALSKVLTAAGISVDVFVAYDTGLHREGARSLENLKSLFARIEKLPNINPVAIYSHEGHSYGCTAEELEATVKSIHAHLLEAREAIHPDILLAPGCSATAKIMATLPGIDIVRPGAYPLGDINLAKRLPVMKWDETAATVLSTVVDKPEPGLALIDAGSKTFSGDKSSEGISGIEQSDPELLAFRVNEEHGYLKGPKVDSLKIGERLRFVPNHICPVMNLIDKAYVIQGEKVIDTWKIEARGCVS
ncbi:MAG: alanine racemase [Chthoniobacterales bacterium]